jgi:hypothetical protein
MPNELSKICKSCPEIVIHNVVRSCDKLMKGFLEDHAPDSEELSFFKDKEELE